MNNPKQSKRAFIAYLSELLHKQKENPNSILEDSIPIEKELKQVEQMILDLDFIIENKIL